MENSLQIRRYLNYKNNYFKSFSEFFNINNDSNKSYINILCCNIRSIYANFDELILFLENDINN